MIHSVTSSWEQKNACFENLKEFLWVRIMRKYKLPVDSQCDKESSLPCPQVGKHQGNTRPNLSRHSFTLWINFNSAQITHNVWPITRNKSLVSIKNHVSKGCNSVRECYQFRPHDECHKLSVISRDNALCINFVLETLRNFKVAGWVVALTGLRRSLGAPTYRDIRGAPTVHICH